MQELSGYIEDRIEERVQPLCMAYDKLCEQNRELIQRIDDLEMYSRKSCVRIFGVSEEKVHTDQVVKDICKDLKVEIKDTDLAVSHRVGPKSVDKPRPIIARINNYSVRHELLQTSKKEKLHKMKDWENVWVNQELTKARGKVAAEVRKLCKNDIAKATFIWDGKIFVIDHSEHKHKLHVFSMARRDCLMVFFIIIWWSFVIIWWSFVIIWWSFVFIWWSFVIIWWSFVFIMLN